MDIKKDYINLIRWSCILDSFTDHYFIRIIVIYLLSQNVTPWVAVSIPIVLEFARLISMRRFYLLERFRNRYAKNDILWFKLSYIIRFIVYTLT